MSLQEALRRSNPQSELAPCRFTVVAPAYRGRRNFRMRPPRGHSISPSANRVSLNESQRRCAPAPSNAQHHHPLSETLCAFDKIL